MLSSIPKGHSECGEEPRPQLEGSIPRLRPYCEPFPSWCREVDSQSPPRSLALRGQRSSEHLQNASPAFSPGPGVTAFAGLVALVQAGGSEMKQLMSPPGPHLVSPPLFMLHSEPGIVSVGVGAGRL